MPRPRTRKRICFKPSAVFFKPRGVPLRSLQIVRLSHEELEAMRLKNIENLSQLDCAERMHTSQSTVQRLLASGYEKVTKAIVEGRAIEVEEK
jgi:predicted DNA-binding protein (UPF0251 family)